MPLRLVACLVGVAFCGLTWMPAARAENDGQPDLDRAIEAKLEADTLGELSAVVDLCQSALDKGLDEANASFASKLLASTLVQRGAALSEAILEGERLDPRWPQLRKLALADLERSIEHDPEQPQAHLLVGRLQSLPGGNRKEALAALERAVRSSSQDRSLRAEALVFRSALHDQIEQRLADLTEAVQLAPQSPKPLRARGLVHLARGNGPEALADLDAALELEPDDAATHEARGLALGMLQKWDEARASYTRAAELAPESASPYIQRGRINSLAGNPDAAIHDVNEALEVDPENLGALLFRSQLLAQAGKPDEALADVNRVLQLRPGLLPALRTRALLLARAGKLDLAIADLEQVHQQEPKDATTLVQLAMLHGARRHVAQAILAYSAAVDLDPKNWTAYRGRADSYLTMGKQKEAIADYLEALELEPKNSSILNNLAWVLATSPDEELRDGKRAIELATTACDVTGYQEAHILSTLAAGYAETGDFATAIHWSKKAVELADESIRENLAKELASYEAGKPWRELQTEPPEPPEASADRDGDQPEDEDTDRGPPP